MDVNRSADEAAAARPSSWGDVADLIRVLDVRPVGEGRFEAALHPGRERSIVEGSQLLGQSILAASRLVPGRRAVSSSMMFVRVVEDHEPYGLRLDAVASGRTFTTFSVAVVQRERVCASGLVMMAVVADDVMRHEADPPDLSGPSGAVPFDMGVTGRDLRIVDGAYTGDPDAPVGPPVLDAWVRFREVPDDPPLHAALLAQFTGHLSIAAAMRPHAGIGEDEAHHSLSTAVNAISLSLHAQPAADRWMLYRHLSTFAGDGMTHSECRVHDEAGRLLASFSVDAMVKAFVPTGPMDARRAL